MKKKLYILSIFFGLLVVGFVFWFWLVSLQVEYDTAVQFDSEALMSEFMQILDSSNIGYTIDRDAAGRSWIIPDASKEQEFLAIYERLDQLEPLTAPLM